MAGSRAKYRGVVLQNDVSKFTHILHGSVGFQKRGNPEAKRQLRFNICPECHMKGIVEQLNRNLAHEYAIPCICMERSDMANVRRLQCDPRAIVEILRQFVFRQTSYFDMVCVIKIQDEQNREIECRRKVSWKPLCINTWNRNNQPTCDNIRITAIAKAFVTIANTPWGNIDLEVTGPDMINRKPYARLGVGINMISKSAWIPGFLFMTCDFENLQQCLNLDLRYPLAFRGKISIGWPKLNNLNEFHPIFEVDTREYPTSDQEQRLYEDNTINTISNNNDEDVEMSDVNTEAEREIIEIEPEQDGKEIETKDRNVEIHANDVAILHVPCIRIQLPDSVAHNYDTNRENESERERSKEGERPNEREKEPESDHGNYMLDIPVHFYAVPNQASTLFTVIPFRRTPSQ